MGGFCRPFLSPPFAFNAGRMRLTTGRDSSCFGKDPSIAHLTPFNRCPESNIINRWVFERVSARTDGYGSRIAMTDVTSGVLSGSGGSFAPSRASDEDGDGDDSDGQSGAGLLTRTKPKTKKPSMYKVLMLNDDYTPMEFVVFVLEQYFSKSREEATQIMLHVHRRGVGICGVYTYDIAETKVNQVMDLARKEQHPLQCTLEKE